MRADSLSNGETKLIGLPAALARCLIRAYQLTLSPLIGNQCRFHPSCSNYALDAIDSHGAVKGSWLALKRLGRCHPFNAGGFDPVPGSDSALGGDNTKAGNSTNQVSELSPGTKEI